MNEEKAVLLPAVEIFLPRESCGNPGDLRRHFWLDGCLTYYDRKNNPAKAKAVSVYLRGKSICYDEQLIILFAFDSIQPAGLRYDPIDQLTPEDEIRNKEDFGKIVEKMLARVGYAIVE